MADNVYNLKFTLSNGDVIDAGQITAPQGPKGDKGDSADIPFYSSTPVMDGTPTPGSAITVARGDHRHPSDTSRQEKLVSGTNIKTINGQSVLGSGDIKSYPIGSIYQSTSSATPGSLFGGTWEQIKDVFLLSAGDTYTAGSTGGSADAVVVNHNHRLEKNGSVLALSVPDSEKETSSGFEAAQTGYGLWSGVNKASTGINPTGVDGSGKNMPPYLTVYMWRRVA